MKTPSPKDVCCPRCGKKLGENLDGTFITKCNTCKAIVLLDSQRGNVVKV